MGLGAGTTALARASLLGAALLCWPLQAEDGIPDIPIERCAQRQLHVKRLDWLDQRQAAVGLTSSGAVLELYVSESGLWTIIVSSAQKVSCITAYGIAWEQAVLGADG